MPDDLQKIATALIEPSFVADLSGTDTPLHRAVYAWDRLKEADGGFQDTVKLIEANDRLSGIGKSEEVRGAARRALASVEKIEAEFSAYAERAITKARNAHRPADVDSATAAVRASEIRQMIAETVGTDSIKFQSLLSDALEGGDAEILDAILTAPSIWPQAKLIPDRDALEAERLEMTYQAIGPETAALVRARSELSSRFEAVRSELTQAAGEASDNLASIANGRAA